MACSYLSSLHPRTGQSKNAVDFEDLWNTNTQRKRQKFLAHDVKGYSSSLTIGTSEREIFGINAFFLVAM